ncbi:alpha/beta hydrolase [Pontibacter sp. Tf4]|uniref:alpha/beta hydrolase n=1 Tax=Pontibacter sp. Tf4 TaxID=2761620 RepID=UPI002105294F|nr:esterase [Pontibacter sp. Tf4]
MKQTELQDDLVLQYLVKPATQEVSKKKAIILLHGVGSNEADLFSLAPLLPAEFIVISARGPVTLGSGRYAWYEVDFSSGKPAINAGQEKQSRERILEFVEQVKQKYSLDEVYLGGFSQGAIMSYSLGLLHPGTITGVVALSGRILQEIRPEVKPGKDVENLKVFIAHGTQDGTLPVHYAREAKEYLQQLQVTPACFEYNGGHQITQEVLTNLANWLQK